MGETLATVAIATVIGLGMILRLSGFAALLQPRCLQFATMQNLANTQGSKEGITCAQSPIMLNIPVIISFLTERFKIPSVSRALCA